MDNKNQPAYPHISYEGTPDGVGHFTSARLGGLTKRELIAAMCLQGLFTGVNPDDVTFTSMDNAIDTAVQAADRLLIHLEKTSE